MSNDFRSFPGDASRGPGYGAPQQPYGQPSYQGGPPHNYAPSGYGAPQGPPPSGKIKPGLGWIVGVWLLAVLSLIVGIGGFAGGLLGAIGDATPTRTFAPGEQATVALDPADKPAIYVSTSGPTNFECSLTGGANPPSLKKPNGQQIVQGTDGVTWEMGLQVGVEQAGDYQIQCTADPEAGTTFGVGRELAAGSLVGGSIVLFLVPTAGFLLAVVVTIVVLVKRSRARKRVAAASAHWGQPGPYGR